MKLSCPTDEDKKKHAPCPGEAQSTLDIRREVLHFIAKYPGKHTVFKIVKKMGLNHYDDSGRVRRACMALWVMEYLRRYVGPKQADTCFEMRG